MVNLKYYVFELFDRVIQEIKEPMKKYYDILQKTCEFDEFDNPQYVIFDGLYDNYEGNKFELVLVRIGDQAIGKENPLFPGYFIDGFLINEFEGWEDIAEPVWNELSSLARSIASRNVRIRYDIEEYRDIRLRGTYIYVSGGYSDDGFGFMIKMRAKDLKKILEW